MNRRVVVVLLLALSACARSAAPAGPEPTLVTPLMLEPPPIYALLGFRERLNLTSEQIVSLDSIATAVKQRNDELMEELRERSQPTRNQMALVVGDEARPVLDTLRANIREAGAAVGRVLSPEQQKTACELFNQERDERAAERTRQSRDRRGSRGMRRGGLRPDTTLIPMNLRVWPWCTPPVSRAATPPR